MGFFTTHTGEKKARIMRRLYANGDLSLAVLEEHGVSPDEPTAKSRGLGDTVKKVTDATGLSKLAKAVEKVTGRPCGCAKRQEALNQRFPYQDAAE